mgnify:CR=1 FL=1
MLFRSDVFREADVRNLPRRLRPLLARRLPTLTDMQLARSHVCIMELCSCTLTSLVARAPQELSDRVMRGLIFQVVYTLACLQAALPGFRHNDLTTNNVLVKCTPRHAGARYTLGHRAFYLHDMPVAAVLADFDFTHVPGHPVLSNERVLGGRYAISACPSPGYDLHVFLKSLHACVQRRARRRLPEACAFLHSQIGRAHV